MSLLDPTLIRHWHAHIYFDQSSRDDAWALRETIERELAGAIQMGRFHEKPVGPHPMWSYQLAFANEHLPKVASWLALNHGKLDVFMHPETDDSLRDHRDCAIWFGKSHKLNLENFG